MRLQNNIGKLIDLKGENPHTVSMATGITYRIVLGLYKAAEIPTQTRIETLILLAQHLGVSVDDLYEVD